MRRLKAEWERQNLILMAFPHKNTDWSDNLEASRVAFFKIAQAIAYSQMVYLLCDDANEAKSYFCSTTNIIFINAKFNDTWLRDYGALSIEENGKSKLLDFKFNGWGGKYEASLDNKINRYLKEKGFFSSELESIDYELEGGSIESDGKGTILTTTNCLCNPNRGGLSKKEVENNLKKYLGTRRVLWIENAFLEGDDTDSHIDMFARFINPDTIAYISCEDSSDTHFKILKEMEKELKLLKRDNGANFNLVKLPFTKAKYQNSKRVPTSYANFLITNKSIIAPIYNDENDKLAINTLKELFKDKEIIPIPSLKLVEQGGSIHCSTMQISF